MTIVNSASTETPPLQNSPVDLRAFRKCLGNYGTGVAVVAAQVDGHRCGMTINSFSALSLSPPLVMWSIRNESSAHQLFTTTPNFSINILAGDQVDLSGRFAKANHDPFEEVEWCAGQFGEPLLAGVAASLSCTLFQILPGGDHTIIIGQVTSFAMSERTPLLFVQGEYRVPSAHVQSSAIADTSPHNPNASVVSVMRLLSQVASQWINEFDIDRAAEQLTRSQSRVLAWLGEGPHTLDELRLNIGLADADLDEDVLYLKSLGYVRRVDPVTFTLTPAGHDKRSSLVARIRQFESAKFARFDPQEVRVFKQLLNRMIEP